MILHLKTPEFPLSGYIELLTFYADFFPDHWAERLLPEGVVELIFDLTETPKYIYDNETLALRQTCKKVWISGLRQAFITISALHDSSMLVVRFRPGRAYPLLHLPLDRLQHQVLDAEAVLGGSVSALREQLLNAPTPAEKFERTERYFLERLKKNIPIHPAIGFSVPHILGNLQQLSIDYLSRKSGYSHKHLISLFDKYVGVSPKDFVRVMRFQKVVSDIGNRREVDWQRVVYECGYYDQAHFIKDFKGFSGFSPRDYLGARGADLNYLPIF